MRALVFEDYIDRVPGGCWLWRGHLGPTGYGQLRINRRRIYVHRLAYELANGPIPDGLQIDHLCRVRHCVNPAHLEAVTHQENMRRAGPYRPHVYARKTQARQQAASPK